MSIINYPKVAFDPNQKVFVSFYINGKRYRLYNGSRAGIDLNPNSFPVCKRVKPSSSKHETYLGLRCLGAFILC